MSHQLIQIISAGGLLAIFLTMAAESAGIPISSEIVVPLGGALAAQGKLSFVGVVVAASAGNLLGSLIAYLLVRRYGEALILGPGRRVGLTAGHLRLYRRGGVSMLFTLQNAQSQVKSADQAVKTARTNLNYATVYAPFDGTIGFSQVKLGETKY